VGQQGRWTRVRRHGWIPRKAIAVEVSEPQGKAPAAQGTPPAKGRGATAAAVVSARDTDATERVQTGRQTSLGAAPEGGTLGVVQSGVPARVVARSGDQVKVQIEGWIPADAIAPSDSAAMVGVTAAEVRATPDRFVGQTVEWRLQIIAVKTADELRAEMAPGQPYLLTRGPLPEPGFVYVAIPSARVAEFQALPPLQELVLRVSIRAAHSKFLATPVAELVSVVSGLDGK
jgi:hypothetical protein